jgi:DNA polymerase III epsilon subunit-like protein
MSLLLLDLEGTGLDVKNDRITEIGAMRTDLQYQPRIIEGEPLTSLSTLVYDESYPDLTEEVEKVTNITNAMLKAEGAVPQAAFLLLGDLVDEELQFVITYNTDYDKQLFIEEAFRNNMTLNPKINWLMQVPWLCAMRDVETNYLYKSWKLMHIALEYGVTVNPKELHRALADVELMRQMLIAANASPLKMFEFQSEPWIYVKAEVTKPWTDNGRSAALAKTAGYSWEKAKGDPTGREFPKQWIKRIKQKDFDKELTLPMKVERILI